MNNWDDEHLGNFFLHFVLIAKGNKETNSEATRIQDKKELISGNAGQKESIQLILNKYCKMEGHIKLSKK